MLEAGIYPDPRYSLSAPVRLLFDRICESEQYALRVGSLQLMVYFNGEKVGGLNTRVNHFYVSKIFAETHRMGDLLRGVGFEWVVKNEAHQYWMRRGPGAAAAFEAAIEAVTGVPF